jgi:hypothetical protein
MEKIVADDPPSEREKRQVDDYIRRRAKPRFYADENVPTVAITILRRLGADVLTVHDARRRGHPDENRISEALRLGRILITCDRDYLDDRRFPLIHCPALIVCDFGRGTSEDIMRTFACLAGLFGRRNSSTNGQRFTLRAIAGQSMLATLMARRPDTGTESIMAECKNGWTIEPRESLIPVPEMQSTFHLHAQRNAFRHRDARQQSRLFARECR